MIIYFTGTGNSEYVARALADRLQDELYNSLPSIQSRESLTLTSQRPWVFVFPTYLSTVAEIFADWIRRTTFTGTKEAYFIATCASSMGSVPNCCMDICKEKEFAYRGTAAVVMPQNYIALFTMTEDAECTRRQDAALIEADRISSVIAKGEQLEIQGASRLEYGATKLVEKMYNGPFTKTRKFRATQDCISCGLCAKNCPMNRIAMKNGKPVWSGSCVHCMACINRCPKQAIEYGKKTEGKSRYVCRAYKKANEII